MSAVEDSAIPDHGQVALSVPDTGGTDDSGDLNRPGDGNPATESPEESDQETDPSSDTDESTESSDPAPPPSSAPAPPPSSPSQPTSTPDGPQSSVEDQVVDIVNTHRAEAGCEPLRVDARLAQAAADHSGDMAERDYFDHTTPEGVTFAERIVTAGFETPGAENIARGQQTATEVMQSWMDSDGHRANILNCKLAAIGIGLETDGMYWTQDFGY